MMGSNLLFRATRLFNKGGFQMKKKPFSKMLLFMFMWVVMTSSSWAGQVVTEEVRSWAKKVIAQEQSLQAIIEPNTVAILYFNNKTAPWA